MGGTSDKNQTKSGGGNGQPKWMTPGSGPYDRMNSYLTTGPMKELSGIFKNDGMTKQMDKWAGRYNDLYKDAGGKTAAEQYLTGTAKGQYLNNNPYIEDMVGAATSDVADSVAQQFSAAGRYGSVANQTALSKGISETSNNLRNTNYQAERDRMIGAANSIDASQNAQSALRSSIAQAGSGLQQQGISNIFSAINALPTVQQNKMFDAQQQGMVGSQIDARTQAALMDRIKQLGGLDMQGWNAIAGLLGAGTQAAGGWGTQSGSQSSTAPGNPFQMIGGIGSLLSFFSDRRLKTGIVRVGEEAGLSLYEFAYAWAPEKRFRGVMAQDVQKARPDAVGRFGGWLTVDYGALGIEMREV